MTTINLKDFYAWYTHDEYIEVSDEVAAELKADKLYEAAYQRRTTRNKAQYSLDCDDGIEYSACLHEPTPQELLDRMELFVHLWNALNSLPEVQGVRVEAHLILGKSYRQIAREQGVDKSAVRHSVKSGKAAMRKYLKKFQFRLQVVLDIKEKLLEQKLLELSKVQRGLQEAIQKQKTLESYQLEINQALLKVFQSGNDLDLVEVQRYKDFINKLLVDISSQKVVVQNITKLLEIKRKEVNDVLKEKKVLEKPKENQQKKYYQEFEQYQRSELDDIATSRYMRA